MTIYTTRQLEAIGQVEGPLQLIACAGSGKTQVISQRISHILMQPGVSPKNVIAFTFTEKAAAELKERIRDVAEGPDGWIYLLTDGGKLIRIER